MVETPSTRRPPAGRPSTASLGQAGRRLGVVLAFAVVPVLLAGTLVALSVGDSLAFDFRQFWQGGRDVLDGRSPYPPAGAFAGLDLPALTPEQVQEVFRFPYPAPVALAIAPLALLPFGVAAAVFSVLLVAAVPLSLHLLGVRDWRCYGATFASVAVLEAVRLGTLTPLLVLALALLWRYRDRRMIAAAALAAAIVAKLFLWPYLVWLVATRRVATAVLSVAAAAAATLGGWAVLGFDGLRDYPELVAGLAEAGQAKGYSAVALGLAVGLPEVVARAAAIGLGLALLAAVIVLARRADGERRAFAAALGAALVLTPIVWLHYFALLAVPIALARPRLSPLWLVPLVLWVTPFPESGGDTWRIVVALAVAAVVVARAAAPGSTTTSTGMASPVHTRPCRQAADLVRQPPSRRT
jgi:hypothetical protein